MQKVKELHWGGGFYKTPSSTGSVIIAEYNILENIKDFTIYFWGYKITKQGAVYTSDSTWGYDGEEISTNGYLQYHNGVEHSEYIKDKVELDKWTFYEYGFKKINDSTYEITCFLNGIKQFTIESSISYIITSRYFLGNWSYPPNYNVNSFIGYVYDFSIYDDILHAENYSSLPVKEMNYNKPYKLYNNKDNVYA